MNMKTKFMKSNETGLGIFWSKAFIKLNLRLIKHCLSYFSTIYKNTTNPINTLEELECAEITPITPKYLIRKNIGFL